MSKLIPYGRQEVTEADISAVVEVLRSNFLTQGPAIAQFEKKITEYTGAKYAVAVSNATAALHIACLAAELGEQDWLWTSPNSFVASANCGLYCGASVDFVDIDKKTYNMDVDALELKLEKAALEKRLPKVVVPVAFGGQSCAMDRIVQLSKKFGFKIIEDASHAIGGKYRDMPIGNGEFADMTVFSFHPVKIITTGEGGMVLTNSRDLYEKLLMLRTHGITRDATKLKRVDAGGWYYEQHELGFNYRITDIQAALGVSQLSRLDRYVERRHVLFERYQQAFEGLPMQLPSLDQSGYSALHLYVVRLNVEKLKKSRKEIFNELVALGVGVNVHYIPIHTQHYYQKNGFEGRHFQNSEWYYDGALTLPLYATLTEADQDFVIEAVKKVLV